MRPLQFVERGIGAYVAFDVEVVAFLDIFPVDVAAQCYAYFGRIYIDPVDDTEGRRRRERRITSTLIS